jgi:hypothetical protein
LSNKGQNRCTLMCTVQREVKYSSYDYRISKTFSQSSEFWIHLFTGSIIMFTSSGLFQISDEFVNKMDHLPPGIDFSQVKNFMTQQI